MKREDRDPGRRRVGVLRRRAGRFSVLLAEKGGRNKLAIPSRHAGGASDGELVVVRQLPRAEMRAEIVERLGERLTPQSYSLIAIKANDIPDRFSAGALAEAQAVQSAEIRSGTDLTGIPFVTIDPPDARDRDDAVQAEPDLDPANPGGFVLRVAIADIAGFVAPGSEIDREARLRGNSTYFPDRTVPMLPPVLAGDACSLQAGQPRPCMMLRMVIDREGRKLAHEFLRGTMQSRAALHYRQAQSLADGAPATDQERLLSPLVCNLWAAWRVLETARRNRQPLDLELPERRIQLSGSGTVEAILLVERLESHRLIEEFMVLANICAAETLAGLKCSGLYRVHEEPDRERIAGLARTAVSCGLPFAAGARAATGRLNSLLARAASADCREYINLAVLRSLTQARYSTVNFGHFGLNLPRYAHFTSPIRRYADLMVHRALIRALGLGPGGLTDLEMAEMPQVADHVSMTERRSVVAEREALDRFAALHLSDRVGAEFSGTIAGTARFGMFVRLDETGSEGILHRSQLGDEHFHHDHETGSLSATSSGRQYRVGMRIRVRLAAADPISGTLQFELPEANGARLRKTRRGATGRRRRRDRRGRN